MILAQLAPVHWATLTVWTLSAALDALNEIAASPAKVSLDIGTLLVFETPPGGA